MGTREPRVGADYATASGLPVRVLEIGDRQMQLQSLASDSCFYVPASYPLGPSTGPNVAVARRPRPHKTCVPEADSPARRDRPLAPIIDAMLLAGGKSMRGMVRELRRKASASCRSRDLRANIRARIYWLKKKGGKLRQNAAGQLSMTSA